MKFWPFGGESEITTTPEERQASTDVSIAQHEAQPVAPPNNLDANYFEGDGTPTSKLQGIAQRVLDSAQNRLRNNPVVDIFVTGSVAQGTSGQNSDLDLKVVTKDPTRGQTPSLLINQDVTGQRASGFNKFEVGSGGVDIETKAQQNLTDLIERRVYSLTLGAWVDPHSLTETPPIGSPEREAYVEALRESLRKTG